MWRCWFLIGLLAVGCSSAPVANFMDRVRPGKLRTDARVTPHGGVCVPSGIIGEPAPPPPVMPPGPLPPPPIQQGLPPPPPPAAVNVPPPPAPFGP